MSPQDLMAAFEVLADAPEGVKRLRELVLDLAVKGCLVPQDPSDEPAVDVVAKAMSTKRQINPRWTPLHRPAGRDITFIPPEGWAWARLDDLCAIVSGVTKGRKLDGKQLNTFPYLRVANVQAGFLGLSVIKTIELPVDELDGYRLCQGDVLLTEGGDWDKLGRSAIWSGEVADCIHQNHVFRARPLVAGLSSRWLVIFTNSLCGREYFQSCAKQTTNLASINMTQLKNCPIPLPPLAEQHRIVARVDELMGLLDRLEAARTAREELRRAARDAALAALRDAEDTEAVEAAWGRIAREMDTLFAEPEDVGPLRQAVLHLAVRGRLIRQDQHDQPASHFLALVAEIKRSTGCGKSRRHTWDLIDSVPWALPDGWAWAPFGDTNINRDGERVPVSAEERQGRVGPYSYFGASGVICRWGSQSASDR